MKTYIVAALLFPAAVMIAAGCRKPETVEPVAESESPAPATVESAAPAAPEAAGSSAPGGTGPWSGTVVETMSTSGYTYVNVDTGAEKIWAASPTFEVQVGDQVTIPPGSPMPDYYSKTLDRTFDVVHFVMGVQVGGEPAAAAAMPPGAHPAPSVDTGDISFEGVAKAEGGMTVAELFSKGSELSGTEVALRGKVVKFSPMIMGKNWIHLQDGTDHEGANDLTITTMDQAAKGDTVLVRGVVTVNKDFGAGYRYDLILEDARVTVE